MSKHLGVLERAGLIARGRDGHNPVRFLAQGAKTQLTMHSVFKSAAELEKVKGFGAVEGGNQTLERLAERLARPQS